MPDIKPLTNGDKARAIGRLFDQGREGDAWGALEYMLRNREWPDWLKEVCAAVDASTDQPTTLKEAA